MHASFSISTGFQICRKTPKSCQIYNVDHSADPLLDRRAGELLLRVLADVVRDLAAQRHLCLCFRHLSKSSTFNRVKCVNVEKKVLTLKTRVNVNEISPAPRGGGTRAL